MVFFLLGLVFWPVERAFARRAWREQDERDFQRSVVLSSEIERIVAQPRAMTMTSAGYRVALDMHLGEVARHFDSSITASVTGWLQHDLAFRGWGVGVAGQHVGLGTGRLGLVGQSSVQLDLSGVARDDLLADGFVAVLDRRDGRSIETLRVVVPSQPMIREIIASMLECFAAPLEHGTHTWGALANAAASARQAIATDVSHVSDVLTAVLRLSDADRPAISVAGVELTEFAILGGAIRVGDEDRTYQLFPFELTAALTSWASNSQNLAAGVAGSVPAALGSGRRCPHCGKAVARDRKFRCNHCGEEFI